MWERKFNSVATSHKLFVDFKTANFVATAIGNRDWGQKTRNDRFSCKSRLLSKKVCYKVCLKTWTRRVPIPTSVVIHVSRNLFTNRRTEDDYPLGRARNVRTKVQLCGDVTLTWYVRNRHSTSSSVRRNRNNGKMNKSLIRWNSATKFLCLKTQTRRVSIPIRRWWHTFRANCLQMERTEPMMWERKFNYVAMSH